MSVNGFMKLDGAAKTPVLTLICALAESNFPSEYESMGKKGGRLDQFEQIFDRGLSSLPNGPRKKRPLPSPASPRAAQVHKGKVHGGERCYEGGEGCHPLLSLSLCFPKQIDG